MDPEQRIGGGHKCESWWECRRQEALPLIRRISNQGDEARLLNSKEEWTRGKAHAPLVSAPEEGAKRRRSPPPLLRRWFASTPSASRKVISFNLAGVLGDQHPCWTSFYADKDELISIHVLYCRIHPSLSFSMRHQTPDEVHSTLFRLQVLKYI